MASKRPAPVAAPPASPSAPARRFRVVLGQLGPWLERSVVSEAELLALHAEVDRLLAMGILRELRDGEA